MFSKGDKKTHDFGGFYNEGVGQLAGHVNTKSSERGGAWTIKYGKGGERV